MIFDNGMSLYLRTLKTMDDLLGPDSTYDIHSHYDTLRQIYELD